MLVSLFLVPLLVALLALVVKNNRVISLINVVGGVGTASIALLVAGAVFRNGPISAYGKLIYIDALSAFVMGIIAVVALTATLYSLSYTRHELATGEMLPSRLRWYYFWLYIFIFTMLAVVVTSSLGFMWVAIEATTLASALLVGFYNHKSSLEAAWKYILICTVGIIFALFGMILLYYAAVPVIGEGNSSLNWQNLLRIASQMNPRLLRLSFIFVLIGYGTKAGLAPMHTWLPDAHSQAPSPVSAMLSGVLLNCALYGILRFSLIISKGVGSYFASHLLLIFGIFSIGIALPFIVVQQDFKRMLAYSSIEHMGIITAAVGLGGRLGLYGAFLHMLNHALTKSSLFYIAGNITQKYHSKKINKIRGVIQTMPISGPALIIGALAIAGSPPFNIFLSEFKILTAGFAQGKYWATGIILVLITMIFTGIIYATGKMALGAPSGKVQVGEINRWSVVMVVVSLLPVMILGIYSPAFIDNILGQVVSVMAGGN